MKTLKNIPSDEYQNVYNELVNFYGIFSKLVDMATSPSGTYRGYLQSYNRYASDFTSSYSKIKILKPEIADYSENS